VGSFFFSATGGRRALRAHLGEHHVALAEQLGVPLDARRIGVRRRVGALNLSVELAPLAALGLDAEPHLLAELEPVVLHLHRDLQHLALRVDRGRLGQQLERRVVLQPRLRLDEHLEHAPGVFPGQVALRVEREQLAEHRARLRLLPRLCPHHALQLENSQDHVALVAALPPRGLERPRRRLVALVEHQPRSLVEVRRPHLGERQQRADQRHDEGEPAHSPRTIADVRC
jgi:hypothetical protein